jgi:ribosomal protein S18 acetylase RimI-like enzyme
MSEPVLRAFADRDHDWAARMLGVRWGSVRVVSRGRLHEVLTLPGLVAERLGQRCGLLTYRIDGSECEVVTLDSFDEGKGVGTALLDAASDAALAAGCKRLWLITTNDNLAALGFYQRWGLRIAAVHVDALSDSREIKPEIPEVGLEGIPLRDEIELEILL